MKDLKMLEIFCLHLQSPNKDTAEDKILCVILRCQFIFAHAHFELCLHDKNVYGYVDLCRGNKLLSTPGKVCAEELERRVQLIVKPHTEE